MNNGTEERGPGRTAAWLDARTGYMASLRTLFEERIPGGARWSYVFGSGLLFLLLSQVVTGIFLALYFVPAADHAHKTVAYITKVVTDGAFLRGIHSYGAAVMVVLLVIHMTQTFMYGSYKGKRELLWVSGCILFALVLGMAFTGYLLPWDERSYFATAVGTNIMSEVPWIGNWMKLALRGGEGMNTLTVSRFYVMHVFLIPLCLLAFVAAHLLLFRKAGPAGTPALDPVAPAPGRWETFYPKQLLFDALFALLLIAILGLLAHFVPKTLGPVANPADTAFIPRPEWYYRPLFQWLKYWEGTRTIIGIFVVPGIITVLLLGLPFYDRRLERRPWRRPVAVGVFSFVLVGLVVLGIVSYRADAHDPAVTAQLARQEKAEQAFMHLPFKPQLSVSLAVAGLKANAVPPNPLAARGQQIFASNGCIMCHGQGGAGTAVAVKLIGIGAKLSPEQLATLIRHPNARMKAGGMPNFPLNDADMQALIAYLDSLH